MEERLKLQLKRIYNDTQQAIRECDFLDFSEILLTPGEEQLIINVNGSQISLIKAATLLRELHARFLRRFVLSAFDLTWDMISTPKRFEYVRLKELELYENLMSSNLKPEEVKSVIEMTIQILIQNKLIEEEDDCSRNDFLRSFEEDSFENITSKSELLKYKQDIQDCVLHKLNAAFASMLVCNVEQLRNSYVGTMERCLASLEQNCVDKNEPPHALLAFRQILNAAYGVEINVQASSSILKIFWEKVKRLLASSLNSLPHLTNNVLASSSSSSASSSSTSSSSSSTSSSTTAYSTNHSSINTTNNNSQLQHRHHHRRKSSQSNTFYWSHNYEYIIDDCWKRRQALEVVENLSEARLAKSICSQFRARLRQAHENFLLAIRALEIQHAHRLQQTEELCLRMRKLHAPRMAKFALESTSLIDLILYGMPCLEKEIGRGQYGVVYGCESWAGHSSCAVKSVVPPDDKHWYDLAMEFYYTRCIPQHERIVNIFGSVIDHSYGNGSTPAVLLVMERLNRDLYSAIRSGLDWLSRLQIAIDVVEGIRFLHNQGLVHRDIKLKNILLDGENRAKITDLGFCKPEAMMSGSVVGTPIHMSPELFSGRYDNSVDVYAFGILFWYICAGHVRLPHIFEQCQTRDQLWSCVRRGVRPERLPQFDNECWQLMVQCWDGDRAKRPHLGDVEIRLRQIHARYE